MNKNDIGRWLALSGITVFLLGAGFTLAKLVKQPVLSEKMGLLEFIVGMTQALAWPGAVAIIFFILRKPLTNILAKVRRLSIWGVDVDVEEVIDNIAQNSAEAATDGKGLINEPTLNGNTAIPKSPTNSFEPAENASRVPAVVDVTKLGSGTPEARLDRLWRMVVSNVRQAYRRRGLLVDGHPMSTPSMAKVLSALELIPRIDVSTITELKKLVLAVRANEAQITSEEIERLVDLVIPVLSRVLNIAAVEPE